MYFLFNDKKKIKFYQLPLGKYKLPFRKKDEVKIIQDIISNSNLELPDSKLVGKVDKVLNNIPHISIIVKNRNILEKIGRILLRKNKNVTTGQISDDKLINSILKELTKLDN